MTEFFHEGATLVVEVDLGEGTRKFSESLPVLVNHLLCRSPVSVLSLPPWVLPYNC